ncbi:glycosyltransferase family 4 protein [Patescibacteria group bacterium]|nr:glycosyltransferase family 4 protein [Patescibacteria group bacterium]
MRLVLATPLYPPDLGGPATYAALIEEYMPGQGDEVTVVKFGEVRHLPRGIRHLAYFFKVYAAGKKAEVILALDPVSTGLPALLAARILGKPFVVKIGGDFAWEQGKQRFGITADLDHFVRQGNVPFPVACLRAVQNFVSHHAQLVIAPSNYLKGIIMAWGIPAQKIPVIYNTIELPAEEETAMPIGNVVVSVGRLVSWKGISELIDAIATIKTTVPDVTLLIVGEGPEKDFLMKKGKEHLGDAIVFAGARSHAETLFAIRTSSVFVLNSSYEGLSHVLIEALGVGARIVATDAGGNGELIEDGKNGLLVAVGDTQALAEAITRLLTDKEMRARLGTHALESAKRFSVSHMIKETHTLLATLTSSTS